MVNPWFDQDLLPIEQPNEESERQHHEQSSKAKDISNTIKTKSSINSNGSRISNLVSKVNSTLTQTSNLIANKLAQQNGHERNLNVNINENYSGSYSNSLANYVAKSNEHIIWNVMKKVRNKAEIKSDYF